MSDLDKRTQEEEGFVPSSPLKRTLAWIGLCYALIMLALITYIFYTGTALTNLGPLLTVPGLVGLGAMALVSWRTRGKPGKWAAIAMAAVLWLLALATLPLGLVGLLSNFPGALEGAGAWLTALLPGDMAVLVGVTAVGG